MTSQNNIKLVQKLCDLMNKHDSKNLHIYDEVCDPHICLHDCADPDCKPGLQNFCHIEEGYHNAFPDKKLTIDNICATDEYVTVCWTVNATHKGSYNDIAPTNKKVKITGISLYKIANGKITEIWQNWDRLGLLEQIGELHLAHAHH